MAFLQSAQEQSTALLNLDFEPYSFSDGGKVFVQDCSTLLLIRSLQNRVVWTHVILQIMQLRYLCWVKFIPTPI